MPVGSPDFLGEGKIMPQGPRRGWVRAAFTGLGVVLCTGLVGCMNSDKDKFPPRIGTNTKQPGPMPNAPRIPGQPGSGGVGLGPAGQPGTNTFQPTGGFGANTGRMGGVPNTGPTNPAGGFGGSGAPAGVVPSMGPGAFQPSTTNNFGSARPDPNFAPISPSGGNPAFANNPPAVTLTTTGIDPIPPSRPDLTPGNYEPLQPPVPASGTFGKGG
jgi:hypothetical protein